MQMWTIKMGQGKAAQADTLHSEALVLASDLLDAYPESEGILTDYFLLIQTTNPPDYDEGRRQHFLKLESIAERRVKIDPSNRAYQQDLEAASGYTRLLDAASSGDGNRAIDAMVSIKSGSDRTTKEEAEKDSSIQQLRDFQKIANGESLPDFEAPKTASDLKRVTISLMAIVSTDPEEAETRGLQLLRQSEEAAGSAFTRPDWGKAVSLVYEALYNSAHVQKDMMKAERHLTAKIGYLQSVNSAYPNDRDTKRSLEAAKRLAMSLSLTTGTKHNLTSSLEIKAPKTHSQLRDQRFEIFEISFAEPVKAEKSYQELLRLAKESAGEDFYSPKWAREVEAVYHAIYFLVGEDQEKETGYAREALTYFEGVVSRHPEDEHANKSLRQAQYKAGTR
jgi:tetratricopeptide (TPR) repeat protein